MREQLAMVSEEGIEKRIHLIRGHRVMLSADLAELYGVVPKVLVQAVKRNKERFPLDFMFQLSNQEFTNLKSQIVTSSWGGLRRAMPYAFTEQGVAMLSSVLRSDRAIAVNIEIMRAFVRLKLELCANAALARRLDELEGSCDKKFRIVFSAIKSLLMPEARVGRRIGFVLKPSDKTTQQRS